MTLKDMLGRSGVVSREDALKTLEGHFTAPFLSRETIQISYSLGRVMAEEILSPENFPEFDRSTMDGYAVRSVDTFGAAESRPALLTVVGDILMGTMPERGIGKGEAMKIATGGALPQGADAVVMFEQTQPVNETSIEVVKAVAPQENVSRVGDDMRKGEVVLSRGHVIRPQDMGALACMGITEVPVFVKPRIAIISTGNELVPADTSPGPGRIRDSNSYNLEGLIESAGGMAVRMGILPDVYDRLREAFEEAISSCHIILFTGGSSVGTADFTARVINDLWATGGAGPWRLHQAGKTDHSRSGERKGDGCRHPRLRAAGAPGRGLDLLRGVRQTGIDAVHGRYSRSSACRYSFLSHGEGKTCPEHPVRSRPRRPCAGNA